MQTSNRHFFFCFATHPSRLMVQSSFRREKHLHHSKQHVKHVTRRRDWFIYLSRKTGLGENFCMKNRGTDKNTHRHKERRDLFYSLFQQQGC